MTIDTTLVQTNEPRQAKMDDGVAMLSVRSGAFFHLNRTGGEIWNLFAERRRISEVCELLSSNYAIDKNTAEQEVIRFVQTLLEYSLLQVVDREQSR